MKLKIGCFNTLSEYLIHEKLNGQKWNVINDSPMVLFPLKIHTFSKIMTRGLIFTCEKCSTDSELFHSEGFFWAFGSEER